MSFPDLASSSHSVPSRFTYRFYAFVLVNLCALSDRLDIIFRALQISLIYYYFLVFPANTLSLDSTTIMADVEMTAESQNGAAAEPMEQQVSIFLEIFLEFKKKFFKSSFFLV